MPGLVFLVCPAAGQALLQPEPATLPEPGTRPAGPNLSPPSSPTPRAAAPAGSLNTQRVAPRWGILGNMGGIRDELYERGILLGMDYSYQTALNAQGGMRGPLLRGAGQFALQATADMERLAGLEGGTAQFTLTHRHGRLLDIDAGLGTLQQSTEIFGRGRIFRLTQLWYDQKIGLMNIKLGRVTVGEDFATFTCEFQNLTLCGVQPGNLNGNYWFNYPVSQWGGRIRIGDPTTAYIQGGLYQVNPSDLDNGFNVSVDRAKGALAIGEIAMFPKFGEAGYLGSYRVGAWHQTGGGDDLFFNLNGLPLAVNGGLPLRRSDREGVYFVGVQELFRVDPATPARNLSMYVRLTRSNPETSFLDRQETVGFVFKGVSADRPNDWIGLGFGQTHVSGRVREGTILGNVANGTFNPVPGTERMIEAFYSVALTPDLVVRPNIQLINRPGGIRGREDVIVLGVKSGITF